MERSITIPEEIYNEYIPLYVNKKVKLEALFFLLGFEINSDGSIYHSRLPNMELNVELVSKTMRFNPIINGRRFIFAIHRLAAFKIWGENIFKEGVEVLHKDKNLENNSFSNLMLGSHSDRMMQRSEEDRKKSAKHAASFNQRYDPPTVIKFFDKNGGSWKATMAEFGMSKSTLSNILKQRGTYFL